MSDEARILQLLQAILESKGTPEEACRECPQLLPEVHKRWRQLQSVEAEVEALFPTPQLTQAASAGAFDLDAEPPRIPGYEVQASLGRGGMGVVYKARHLKLNRTVAIKMMLAGGYADRQQLTRFLREAETVAGLRHAHIVQVYDVGDLDGLPYFTMEFVGGGSLAQQLAGMPQPAHRAAALVATLAGAVHLAHQGGVVHRDLKPANILLAGDGTPKISDFGLAQRIDGGPGLTLSGVRLGTPSYMAPEQALGKADAVGPAVDIYALGAILYEMLTGRPPFKAETAAETERQLIAGEPAPPSRLNAKVPRDLETICLKCLHKDPQRRYPTAAALAEDLDRFQRGEPIVARRAGWLERTVKLARRRPTAAALLGVSALGLVALAVGPVVYNRQLEATRRATRAADLVQSLAVADTPGVPRIIEDLEPLRRQAEPLLARMLAEAPAGSKARLHASLALLPGDDSQVDYLADRLLTASPQELLVIRTSLAPSKDRVKDRLWTLAQPPSPGKEPDEGRRFRAACGLAALDPDSPRWAKVASNVAASLAAESPLLIGAWTELLRPARRRLLDPLTEIALRRSAHEQDDADPELRLAEFQHRAVAVSILADYASDQPKVLAKALVDVGPKPFEVLFPKLAVHGHQAVNLLSPVLERTLPSDAADADHDRLAQRQANAAVALMRLGHADRVWPLLRHRPDPGARSYLIHRVVSLGVDPRVLLRRFEEENDISARRALLLALGGFRDLSDATAPEATEHPPTTARAARLLDLYRTHPDAGLHAAAAWTLRQWGHGKELAEIDKQLVSSRPGGKEAGWSVNSQGQTMVAIPGPVEFSMGSPETEPQRDHDEVLHTRRIGRSFAMAAHHVTVEQFKRFNPRFAHPQLRRAPDPDCPIIGVTWYEAAQYCNWLSRKEGIPKDQWCYLPNAYGNYAEGMELAPDYLERQGYRLPTEAEWEYCCRAGAATARYYGRSEELLPRYAWYIRNAKERSWPVGSLKPNDLGLFDMHGAAWSWCSDSYLAYKFGDDITHQTLVTETVARVLRGGSFFYPRSDLRAANRNWVRPSYRNYNVGFRVARTLVLVGPACRAGP
ncbi:MAG: bifunctional serine/threonine-protein kinase/formylglycine-generating enzyme family protein [Gemmataceae bacterium]|nr:bifunctional serine/threonine-protein kinase/formylglycine-generating enzyme family protein [Gemmataceae bacterium]